MKKSLKTGAILLALLCLVSLDASAQRVRHDREKMRQWKSMEIGPWDFAPGSYYVIWHNKYSGGNGNILHPRFKESRSDVQMVGTVRTASAALQESKKIYVKAEALDMKSMAKRDKTAQADRVADVVYSEFKSDFKKMQELINEGVTFAYEKSHGQLKPELDAIVMENDVITESIKYLHKTGVDAQLENSRRKKGYEDCKESMRKLVAKVYRISQIAQTLY